jgi:hypothetical protein
MRSGRTLVLVGSLIAAAGVGVVAPGASGATLTASGAGAFTAVGPNRILDTRINLGITSHLGTTHKDLQVTGRGNVPSTNVSAVVFNLTVTNPTASSYVTVWPTGASQPTASNINFVRGWTGANLVTVKVSTSGKVSLFNRFGTVDVIADVVGWYSDSGGSGAGNFQVLGSPTRLWDSRTSSSLPGSHVPMQGGSTLTQPVNLTQGTTSANAHVKALVVSLTAVNPQASGHFTAWSGVGNPPTASVLNYTKNSIVPNLAIVPVAPCACPGSSNGLPSIAIRNVSNGSTNILIDLWGFYDDGALSGGLRFSPLNAPIRIVDTRSGLGGASTLHTGSTRRILAPASVAGPPTQLLVQNVTSVPQSNTYVSLWPHGVSRPTVSNLNPRAGRNVAGLAYTGVGGSNDFDIYNSTGTNDIIIDVAGSMEATGSAKAAVDRVQVAPVIQASSG